MAKRIKKKHRQIIRELIDLYGAKAVAAEAHRSPSTQRGPGAPEFDKGTLASVWATVELRRGDILNLKRLGVEPACKMLRDDETKFNPDRRPYASVSRLRAIYKEADDRRGVDPEFEELANSLLAQIKAALTSYPEGAVALPARTKQNSKTAGELRIGHIDTLGAEHISIVVVEKSGAWAGVAILSPKPLIAELPPVVINGQVPSKPKKT